jgi:hypothetical protein
VQDSENMLPAYLPAAKYQSATLAEGSRGRENKRPTNKAELPVHVPSTSSSSSANGGVSKPPPRPEPPRTPFMCFTKYTEAEMGGRSVKMEVRTELMLLQLHLMQRSRKLIIPSFVLRPRLQCEFAVLLTNGETYPQTNELTGTKRRDKIRSDTTHRSETILAGRCLNDARRSTLWPRSARCLPFFVTHNRAAKF